MWNKEQIIQKIINKEFGESTSSVQSIFGGSWSTVYKVILSFGSIAIKIHPGLDDGFVIEKDVMERAIISGLPVPKPIVTGILQDENLRYLAMNYVEGFSLNNIWETLPDKQRMKTCKDILEIIQEINKIKLNGFGSLNPIMSGHYATLAEYLDIQVESFAKSPIQHLIDKKNMDKIQHMFLQYSNEYRENTSHLVHADVRLSNFIYHQGELNLIDFGNAIAMLPGFDIYRFTRVDYKELLSEREVNFLISEYVKINPKYTFERPLYKALVGFGLSTFLANHGNFVLMRHYLKDIIESHLEYHKNIT